MHYIKMDVNIRKIIGQFSVIGTSLLRDNRTVLKTGRYTFSLLLHVDWLDLFPLIGCIFSTDYCIVTA